jgi:hypothetical protein
VTYNGIAAFDFDRIVIDGGTLVGTGSQPLALLSRGDILFTGGSSIDLSGRDINQPPGIGGFGGPGGFGGGPGGGSGNSALPHSGVTPAAASAAAATPAAVSPAPDSPSSPAAPAARRTVT